MEVFFWITWSNLCKTLCHRLLTGKFHQPIVVWCKCASTQNLGQKLIQFQMSISAIFLCKIAFVTGDFNLS